MDISCDLTRAAHMCSSEIDLVTAVSLYCFHFETCVLTGTQE